MIILLMITWEMRELYLMPDKHAKILIVDIETAPKVAYVWRFFKENIGAKQVREHGHIMSFAAKWLNSDDIIYEENRKEDDSNIVSSLVDLFDQADIVVAHNGQRFDFPQIMGRAVVHGIKPPSPYKIVDTLKVSRFEFGFPSHSLEYLAKVLGCKEKLQHKNFPGFELWLECLRGNNEAWKEMREYNIQDIITLEEIYLKMRPWMRRHPNIGAITEDDKIACPKCGSHKMVKRGFAYTNVGKYQRYVCNSCGGWSRSRYTLMPDEAKKNLVVNQVN